MPLKKALSFLPLLEVYIPLILRLKFNTFPQDHKISV